MGRHNRRPTKKGTIVKKTSAQAAGINEAVVERMGLNDQVCMRCNCRTPPNADKCRKCGHTQLRPRKSDYSDA